MNVFWALLSCFANGRKEYISKRKAGERLEKKWPAKFGYGVGMKDQAL